VETNKRDYTNKIITELTTFEEACSMTVNFICFHKSSFQNELLRLTRHNKFAIELMNQMVALGIEQPRKQFQVSGRDFPIYQTNISPPSYHDQNSQQSVDPAILTATRRRGNSRAGDNHDMFQDVFVSRKIANNNIPTTQLPPRINEEPPSGVASVERTSMSLMSNIDRAPSNGSGRGSSKGLFSRSIGTLRKNSRSNDRSNDRFERDRDFV
jgi:hypothetical protein